MRYSACWTWTARRRSASRVSSSAIRARAAASSSGTGSGNAKRPLVAGRPARESTERGRGRTVGCASSALEVALAVPVVDDRVVQLLLDTRRVEVVGDDVLAEDLAGRLRPIELPDRLPQRARHARRAGRHVAVAPVFGDE